MLHDIRLSLRLFAKNPGYTIASAATLAIGIGVNVAIFSVLDAVLLRPLPYHDQERLVVPVSTNAGRGFTRASVPFADYLDWREEREIFDSVAVFSPRSADLTGGDRPERVEVNTVSEAFFRVMGTQPAMGRTFTADDHRPDGPRVVVLSDTLWRRVFGADTSIVGRDIALSGTKATVIGVMPPRSVWPDDAELWTPIRTASLPDDVRSRRDNMIFLSVARLKPGVSIGQGAARIRAIAQRIEQQYPEARKGWSSNLIPLRDYIVGTELRLILLVLMGAVAFVLLIACANVANLLLARGAARHRELAVKAAMGASRGRLVRQLLTESTVLAAIGGAAGIALGYWLTLSLIALAPPDVPLVADTAVDARILIVSAGLSLATVLAFGLVPSLTISTAHPIDALRLGSRSASEGRRAGLLRDALVVAEIAIAIVLLAGAGLMMRSVQRIQRVQPGADIDRVIVGRLSIPASRYPEARDAAGFLERLVAGLSALPGAESAAAASTIPVGGPGFRLGRVFLREGDPQPPAGPDHQGQWNVVTPGFFRTLAIPIVEGRDFDARDTDTSTPVVIINQTMARRMFGDRDPIGARIRSWRDENVLREIVGVAADVRYDSLTDDARGLVYVPHRQNSWGAMLVAVRSANPLALAAPLRQTVARIDPNIAVAQVDTMAHFAAESVGGSLFSAFLLALFAGVALLLAAIGIYGVMSYSVVRRTREIGLRVALGADSGAVVGLIARRGMLLTIGGIALGLGGAFALTRVMGRMLFEVSATDPVTFALVPLVLGTVAMLACYIPARRATRVDPMVAFRAE